jgi:hypothetical protein
VYGKGFSVIDRLIWIAVIGKTDADGKCRDACFDAEPCGATPTTK